MAAQENNKELEWNVFYHNFNLKKIEKYNIFDHASFRRDVLEYLKTHKDNIKDFETAVKSSLMYFFWAKAEWEILICPWVGGDREKEAKKIDVYEQVMNNWKPFVDYLWQKRNTYNGRCKTPCVRTNKHICCFECPDTDECDVRCSDIDEKLVTIDNYKTECTSYIE